MRTTPDPGWRIRNTGAPSAVEGWADRVSVRPGEAVQLYLSTTAPTLRVTGFRMGWYSGAEALPVYRSPVLTGRRQRSVTSVAATRTVTTAWTPSVTVPTAGWTPGSYLFRLDASTGAQRYVPLTVLSPSNAGRVVVIDAVTTWQAYNTWGGFNLYHGPGGPHDYRHRAYAVSFDRPYAGDGAGDFVGNELPLISLAERLHLPLGYATDIDLHADPSLLRGARAMISLGHDEYWSSAMRAAATRARDAGTNLAFLGANAVYRHIRLAATDHGPDRLEINYKRASIDPLYGHDNAEVTVNWRDPPTNSPENTLTGVMYACNPVRAPMVITDPDSWLLRGLGLRRGSLLPGLVGSEYDKITPGGPVPQPITVLAQSPVRCRGQDDHADAGYYTIPGGAEVFDSGTSAWVAALDPSLADATTHRIVTAATQRLLTAFAAGPAGRHQQSGHPAVLR